MAFRPGHQNRRHILSSSLAHIDPKQDVDILQMASIKPFPNRKCLYFDRSLFLLVPIGNSHRASVTYIVTDAQRCLTITKHIADYKVCLILCQQAVSLFIKWASPKSPFIIELQKLSYIFAPDKQYQSRCCICVGMERIYCNCIKFWGLLY